MRQSYSNRDALAVAVALLPKSSIERKKAITETYNTKPKKRVQVAGNNLIIFN